MISRLDNETIKKITNPEIFINLLTENNRQKNFGNLLLAVSELKSEYLGYKDYSKWFEYLFSNRKRKNDVLNLERGLRAGNLNPLLHIYNFLKKGNVESTSANSVFLRSFLMISYNIEQSKENREKLDKYLPEYRIKLLKHLGSYLKKIYNNHSNQTKNEFIKSEFYTTVKNYFVDIINFKNNLHENNDLRSIVLRALDICEKKHLRNGYFEEAMYLLDNYRGSDIEDFKLAIKSDPGNIWIYILRFISHCNNHKDSVEIIFLKELILGLGVIDPTQKNIDLINSKISLFKSDIIDKLKSYLHSDKYRKKSSPIPIKNNTLIKKQPTLNSYNLQKQSCLEEIVFNSSFDFSSQKLSQSLSWEFVFDKAEELKDKKSFILKVDNHIYLSICKFNKETCKKEYSIFRIDKLLGSGAFGKVFLGIDKNGKKVAIKDVYLKDERILTLEKHEKGILKELNLLKVDSKIDDDYFIVMKHFKGINLKNLLKNEFKLFDSFEKLRLMLNMCEELQKIHDQGIVHRDIKPENFLIKKKEQMFKTRLIDYGFAFNLSEKNDPFVKLVCGTPVYFAPEVGGDSRILEIENFSKSVAKEIFVKLKNFINDKSLSPNYSFKSDIYSLGVIFYRDFGFKKSRFVKEMLEINPDCRPELSDIIANIKAELNNIKSKKLSSLTSSLS